jgi:hypothetical protein
VYAQYYQSVSTVLPQCIHSTTKAYPQYYHSASTVLPQCIHSTTIAYPQYYLHHECLKHRRQARIHPMARLGNPLPGVLVECRLAVVDCDGDSTSVRR